MKPFSRTACALIGAIALLSTQAMAQTWDAQQTAVWEAVSMTWEIEQAEESSWIADMTTANVSGWSTGNPAPRGRDSLRKWNKLQRANSETMAYELAPLSIAVSGSAAIAHYYYTDMSVDGDGKRETAHGYCSDTLVKQADKWVYLGWNCGDIPAKK